MKTLLTPTRPPSPCYSTTNFRRRRRTISPTTTPTLFALTLMLLCSITSRSPSIVVVAAILPDNIRIPSATDAARGTIFHQRHERRMSEDEEEDCDTERNQCRSPKSGLCENEVTTCLVDPCDATDCEFGACEANYCGGCHAMCLGVSGRRQAKESKGDDGDVASDGAEAEETDVHNGVEELIEEAEEEAEEKAEEESDKSEGGNGEATTKTSKSSSAKASSVSSPGTFSANTANNTHGRSAWVAHGLIGSIVFGLLVPLAISSAFFRDLIPTYWIYIHVVANVATFAMTFFAVGIAFATMNGMGNRGEGHLKEMHHIVGLLLLLVVSFQTANGFLRPPREFYTDDEHDTTPGAVLRSSMNDKSMTARTLWYLVHGMCGLLVFALGSYQVRSGLGLFSRRYGTPDWGTVYIAYVGWLVGIMLIGKALMKWKERQSKLSSMEIQMGRGEGGNRGVYDPENDLTVAQFETV
mmetsp:Transcript_25085/g.45192  ORF Transcript_25085/g.45192 Transcript_25085/m.45192 type:complete len:469 (-) Transcript_25085:40-1446(-)